MAMNRYGARTPAHLLNPEALVERARQAASRAKTPEDAAAREAIAWAEMAEWKCVDLRPERTVAVGRGTAQVRKFIADLDKPWGGKWTVAATAAPRATSRTAPATAPAREEPAAPRYQIERLPEIQYLSPEEFEEKVEDVSAEILSQPRNQLRGGALRVEVHKLLGAAGYRKARVAEGASSKPLPASWQRG